MRQLQATNKTESLFRDWEAFRTAAPVLKTLDFSGKNPKACGGHEPVYLGLNVFSE